MAQITLDLVIIEVKRRLQTYRSDAVVPSRTDDIEGLVRAALYMMCERAKMDSRVRRLMTKTFAVSALDSNGELVLKDTWADIFIEGIEIGSRLVIGDYTNDAAYYADWGHFKMGTPRVDTPRYTVLDGVLSVRTANDDANGLTVLLTGIYIPTINLNSGESTLHVDLEEEFFDLVANLQITRSGIDARQQGPGK